MINCIVESFKINAVINETSDDIISNYLTKLLKGCADSLKPNISIREPFSLIPDRFLLICMNVLIFSLHCSRLHLQLKKLRDHNDECL